MPDTIRTLDSGLRVGYVGLGYRGDVAGSIRQEVHDGDTIKAKPIGNLSIRFLGIDTPEISFQFPGTKNFIGLSNSLWTDFLSDPFAAKWQQPQMDQGLMNFLMEKTGQATAENHYNYAVSAEKVLESEVLKDLEFLGQTSDSFQFFLAFADEIMDTYGRLLSYVNRNESKKDPKEQRPLSYNERLLASASASPYFIFPNISPFYNNKLEDSTELSPSNFRSKIRHDSKLRLARESVKKTRADKKGIYDSNNPLKILPFELRFLAQRRLPNRWVIDLSTEDNFLIDPQKYYLIENLEDRFYIPYKYVPLFVESGWKRGNMDA